MGKVHKFSLIITLMLVLTAEVRATDIGYSGRITDGTGKPVAGPLDLEVKFYDAAKDGNQLGPALYFSKVKLVQGVFTIRIHVDGNYSQTVLGGGAAWIQVRDKTNNLTMPRQRYLAVPYALRIPVDGDTLDYNSSGELEVRSVPTLSSVSVEEIRARDAGGLLLGDDAGKGVFVKDGGSVGIGTTNPQGTMHVVSSVTADAPSYIFEQTNNYNQTSYDTYSSLLANHSGQFVFRRARGSAAAPAAVASGDQLGGFYFRGYDGNSWEQRGGVAAYVEGAVSDGNIPTGIRFFTGSAFNDERMRLDSAGRLGIGTQGPLARLQVTDSPGNSGAAELLALQSAYIGNSAAKALTWRDAADVVAQIDTRYDGTNMNLVLGHLYSSGHQTSDVMTLSGSGNVGIQAAVPHSTLHVAGSIATGFRTVSGDDSLGVNDSVLTVDASGGSVSITLPDPAGITGRAYTVKKIDATANAVTVVSAGGETIDGSLSYALPAQWDFVILVSDGANWIVTGR